MYEFKYHRPTTVRQAANLLTKKIGEAMLQYFGKTAAGGAP